MSTESTLTVSSMISNLDWNPRDRKPRFSGSLATDDLPHLTVREGSLNGRIVT
jgi:hypothetical protein